MTKTNEKLRLIAAIQSCEVPIEVQQLDGITYDPVTNEYYMPTPWLEGQSFNMLLTIFDYVRTHQNDVANSRDKQPVLPGSDDQP